MTDTWTDWHTSLEACLELELCDCDTLDYRKEYEINKKPVRIDTLIISADRTTPIDNEIGHIFRKYNLIEFKSPDDQLDFNTFIKEIGYAYLLKANEKYIDQIDLSDMSISFVWQYMPHKLFTRLQQYGFCIVEKYAGIYYIENYHVIPIQFIIIQNIDKEKHVWLSAVAKNISQDIA